MAFARRIALILVFVWQVPFHFPCAWHAPTVHGCLRVSAFLFAHAWHFQSHAAASVPALCVPRPTPCPLILCLRVSWVPVSLWRSPRPIKPDFVSGYAPTVRKAGQTGAKPSTEKKAYPVPFGGNKIVIKRAPE